jgi:1A family penicillin-binding protein
MAREGGHGTFGRLLAALRLWTVAMGARLRALEDALAVRLGPALARLEAWLAGACLRVGDALTRGRIRLAAFSLRARAWLARTRVGIAAAASHAYETLARGAHRAGAWLDYARVHARPVFGRAGTRAGAALAGVGRGAGAALARARHRAGPAFERLRVRIASAAASMRRRATPALTAVAAALAAGGRHAARAVRALPRPGLGAVAMAGGVLFLVSWLAYSTCGYDGCPDVDTLTVYQPNGAPVLLDRNGEKFADLAPFERVVVPLDELPPHVPAAFIAIEDRRFYRHDGVDWARVVGAAWANVRARGIRQGSSTIPMQLARNIFPTELPGTERTFRRKLQEARVAQLIEKQYTKEEILELYLNHIYFGGGAWGVDAAARRYFGAPASELTTEQAALLAAMPKAPAHYDPRRHPERAKERRDLVLALMEQQQLIDDDEAQRARAAALGVPKDAPRDRSGVPLGAYFIDVVRDQLDAHLGGRIYRTGLRIHTTLDTRAQQSAERELESRLTQLDGQVRRGDGPLQGAVVVMDAQRGDVLALVGGRDPTVSRYNRALLGQRQVGSAFKPFVFAAAVNHGFSPGSVVMDAPIAVQVSRTDVWQPGNYDGRYDGPVTVRDALVRSRNVPTVRLASAVGISTVAGTARAAGVTARMDETPALALGTPSITPLQMATAYTTFATLGTTALPRFVLRVEDEDGTILWQATEEVRRRTLSPAVAYIVTDMLRDAVDRGTGAGVRSAGFRGPVAGKTGTTNNATDVWFVGYTPDVVGAVWIGYDRPSSLGNAATGGGFAAPVWGRVMREVYAGRPQPQVWQRPDSVVVRRIDPQTGLILADGCHPSWGGEGSELFLLGHEPGYVCPYRGGWLADLWGRVSGRDSRELQRAQREYERERQRAQREYERQMREYERQMREYERRRAEWERRNSRGGRP